MKTEHLATDKRVLKMEVLVMRAANAARCRHIPICEEVGCFEDFLYVVMTLAWLSLDEIRRCYNEKTRKLSTGCAISVGIQCLEGIQGKSYAENLVHINLRRTSSPGIHPSVCDPLVTYGYRIS